jgi:hypothetical protein
MNEMIAAMESLVSEFQKELTEEQAGWFPRLTTVAVVLGEANYSTHSVTILPPLIRP